MMGLELQWYFLFFAIQFCKKSSVALKDVTFMEQHSCPLSPSMKSFFCLILHSLIYFVKDKRKIFEKKSFYLFRTLKVNDLVFASFIKDKRRIFFTFQEQDFLDINWVYGSDRFVPSSIKTSGSQPFSARETLNIRKKIGSILKFLKNT